MKNGQYLLSAEKVSKAFWKLAIPALLTTLISQIYNLTDTYFIGMLDNTAMLSAVSIAMPFMWLVNALSGMIGAGAPQLISLKDGAGDKAASARCRSFAVYGTLIMSLIITPVAMFAIDPVLGFMTKDAEVAAYAAEYLRIIIGAISVSAVSGAIQGVLRAGGRTTHASIASIAGIVTNIILDPVFILAFDMGMAGAAVATALGSAVSLVVGIFYIRGEISLRNVLPSAADIALMFKISLASTISSVITALTVGASFTMASSLGGNTMASVSVTSKIYSTVVSVISALAFSIQPFIGYNYGSGNHVRLMNGLGISLFIGEAVGIVGTLAFIFGGNMFMRLFTADAALIATGAKMLRLMAIGLPVAAIQMNGMSYMSATGKAMRTLGVSLGRQIFSMVLMLVLQHFMGETGLMLAYPITDIVATVPSVMLCIGEIKSMFAENRAAKA